MLSSQKPCEECRSPLPAISSKSREKGRTSLELEELQADLRQAQQRLRHLVDFMPAVLFTLSIVGDRLQAISWLSENVHQLLGYPPEAALESDWLLANIHPEDRHRVVEGFGRLLTHNQTAHEFRYQHAGGSYLWTRCELRLIRDESGRPAEAVGALLDITQRKRAEDAEARLREQLEEARKLETIGRFAGLVAHDFNNLLTIITGYSGLALEELQPGNPLHNSISEIRMAVGRAALLTKELLILSHAAGLLGPGTSLPKPGCSDVQESEEL
jgi:PAS domain S-box-containing protein